MVSRLPTWSSKLIGRRIPRDMVLPLFVLVVLVVAFLLSFPWQTMTVLSLVYLASLPLELARVPQAARRRRGGGSPAREAAADRPAGTDARVTAGDQ